MSRSMTVDESAIRGALDKFWNESDLTSESQMTTARRNYLEFQARRYLDIIRFLSPMSPFSGKQILDLGGGVGSLDVAMHATFGGKYDVADYFLPPPSVAKVSSKYGIRQAYRCNLTDPDPLVSVTTRYDFILMVEVIEHLLVNPRVLFRGLKKYLNHPGYVLIATPNQARVTNRLRLLRGRSIRDGSMGDIYAPEANAPNGHVVEYTLSDLRGLFQLEGYALHMSKIVQNPASPEGNPIRAQSRSPFRRLGIRMLNTGLASRLALGDELLGLFRLD